MAADARRHVILLGVEIVDEAAYARYRAAMTPILGTYGGSFGVDLAVARVLRVAATLGRTGSSRSPFRIVGPGSGSSPTGRIAPSGALSSSPPSRGP
jgi:hypothetical protein